MGISGPYLRHFRWHWARPFVFGTTEYCPRDWALGVLSKIDSLPVRGYRRMGLLSGPASVNGAAFVKVYHKPKTGLLPKIGGMMDAISEAGACQKLASLGLPVPRLLFHAIEPLATNGRGVLAQEAIPGPTIFEVIRNRSLGRADTAIIERTAALLATIHHHGRSHGDANLFNFLIAGDKLFAVDVVRSKRLTVASQRKDIGRFLSHAYSIHPNRPFIVRLLHAYRETLGERSLPASADELLEEAIRLSSRFDGRSRWVGLAGTTGGDLSAAPSDMEGSGKV